MILSLSDPSLIDYNDKESMRQRLLGNDEFTKIEEEHTKEKTKAAIQCAIAGIAMLVVVVLASISLNSNNG